jgi:hypothetical protein
VVHDFKEFLHHVIVADEIFKGQVEFVFRFHHFVVFWIRHEICFAVSATEIAASAVNIDRNVFAQLFDVPFSQTVCGAMRRHPNDRARVIGSIIPGGWKMHRFNHPVRLFKCFWGRRFRMDATVKQPDV